MNLKNMKISARIIAGYVLLLLLVLTIIGAISYSQMRKIANGGNEMYGNYLTSIIHLTETERAFHKIYLLQKNHIIAPNEQVMSDLEQQMVERRRNMSESLKKFETLLDAGEETETFYQFTDKLSILFQLNDKIIGLSRANQDEEANTLSVSEFLEQFNILETLLQNMVKNNVDSADQANRANQKTFANATLWLLSAIFFSLLLGGVLGNWISQSIAKPIQRCVGVARQLADGRLNLDIRSEARDETGMLLNAMQDMVSRFQIIISAVKESLGSFSEGKMTARIEADFVGDFAEIKRTANTMAAKVQGIISETSKILGQLAGGNMQISITREFLGDFAEIRTALETTARKLDESTTQNNIQNWFKAGQAQLNETLSGDQNFKQLAEKAINFLTPYLNAQVGALYLLEEEGGEPQLRLVATHAYTWRKNATTTYKIGEGIVGQSAYEGKPFVIGKAPEDHMLIDSGLGESTPRAILVMPFMYEGKLKGIVELATLETFNQAQLDFLNQAMPILAIAINTAESRAKVLDLLTQSQTQTEQLQQQTEELEAQQTTLQQANEELQSQSEELQSQQEELRQINEELEERTKALERQQREVREKNDALEKAKAVVQAKAEELEMASKYKSEFLANMSHELRTPLNSLLILSQLLASNKEGTLSDKQREYAHTIHSAGTDLLNLINDILDLSKVEAGRVEIHAEEVLIANVVISLTQKFRPLAEQKALDFYINVAANLPLTIFTDEQRLKQILINLLGNAFKFTQQGKITLDIVRPEGTDLSRSGTDPNRAFAFTVSDSGIGIPKDKQKVIFEAFQQADGSTSRKYGGTGLGLSISRQLAQLLGGEIQVQSEFGVGSQFTLYLPDHIQETHLSSKPFAQATSQFHTPTLPVETAMRHEKIELPLVADDRAILQANDKIILIIEDDRAFAKMLMDLGQEKGFKCLLAEDGESGLSLVKQYHPNAVLLDLGLPQVDGWTVMEKLKEDPKTRHLPVHFISGADYSIDAKKMGAIGYSLKPVSIEELSETFKKIEAFLKKTVKMLLIVSGDVKRQNAIADLVKGFDAEAIFAPDQDTAWQKLNTNSFDCVVLDVDAGITLLTKLSKTMEFEHPPLIVYAERPLTRGEQETIQKGAADLTVKEAHSRERLLDEVTLFLHQVENKLSPEKQKLLHKARHIEDVLSGKKVLVVDDDTRNLFSLTAALEEKGMEVIAASNGKKALSLLEQHPKIDVVLMDIMMPEMDGYETIRYIRATEQLQKLPIIALTAKAMKGDKAKCIEAGANDYLSKPIDPPRLISLLRVWLTQ